MKKLIILFILLVFASVGHTATIYVDPDDCTNGITTYNPTTRACSGGSYAFYTHPQNAVTAANPGDTIIVRDGTYTDTNSDDYVVRFYMHGGTSGNPITLQAENKWGAVLDGEDNTDGAILQLYGVDSSYVTIQGFEMKDGHRGVHTNYSGADTWNAPNYLNFYNNKIHNTIHSTIGLSNGTDYVNIDGNVLYNMSYVLGEPADNPDGSTCGVSVGGTDNTITNNIMYHNGDYNGVYIQTHHNSSVYVINNLKIINNTFGDYSNSQSGLQGILLYGKPTNVKIENNIYVDDAAARRPLVYCYSIVTGFSAVANNNLTASGTDRLSTDSCDGTNITFSNNITASSPFGFVNESIHDYHLATGHPAIEKGLNTNAPAVDFDDVARPQGTYVDIGTYERITEEVPQTYYIDYTGGSDGYNGESALSAWKTIAKVNAHSMTAGNSYLFKRGETWAGEILIPGSSGSSSSYPITFGAYDSGERPVISAKGTVSSWSEVSGSGQLTIDYNTADYQTKVQDTYLHQQYPTNEYGTTTYVRIERFSSWWNRTIMKIDFSALPEGATISNADLSLYYYSYPSGDPVNLSVTAHRMTRTNWGENTSNWDTYDGSNSWTTAGGDYDNTYNSSITMPATYGWVTWDITSMAQDAQANYSEILYTLIRFTTESGASKDSRFASTEYTADTSLRPKLVIDYSTGSSNLYKKTGVTTAPTKMWFDTVLGTEDAADCGGTTPNANNEWCYKVATSELYIFSTSAPSGRTIERNYPYAIDINGKDYIIIENVEVKNAGVAGIALRGDADNNIIRQSKIHDNDDGIQISGTTPNDNEIHYNILYDNTDDGISVETGTGHEVYNNIFYSNTGDGIYISGDATGTFKNNISSENTGYAINKIAGGATPSTVNKNQYYPTAGTPFSWEGVAKNFADWKTACTCDGNSYNADPLFTDAANKTFTVSLASSCIDHGDNVSLLKDYSGATLWVGSAPDIGAFEMWPGGQLMNAIFFGFEF